MCPLQGPGLWVPSCTPRGGVAGPRTPVQSAAGRLSRQRLAGGGRAARVPTEASWTLSRLVPLGQGQGVTILMSHLGALVPAPARAAAPSFLTQRAEPPQALHLLWPMARATRSPWGSRWLTNTFPLVFSTGEGCSVLTSAVPKGAVPSDVGHWKNFISPAGVGGRSVFYSGGALGAGTGAGLRGAAQGLQGLASGPKTRIFKFPRLPPWPVLPSPGLFA